SKVVAIVGEINEKNEIEIIGVGSNPSIGLKRGAVVNIESTVKSIKKATKDAEDMAGCKIYSTFTGIAGSHIRSLNSHGIVAIQNREVSNADIERVIDAAKAVAIPADQKLLHIIPQEYVIDSQEGIKDPVGMSGVRLESRVHMVSGSVSAAQNIVKCVRKCGLSVGNIILEQLASSHVVLTEDEKELGVCLVDIGGGTTDIAIFTEGSIRHTANIPIAGDQVTNDIAVAIRTPTKAAEEIKLKHGCALMNVANPGETIEVPSINEKPSRNITKIDLAEVIEARYEELFRLVRAELRKSGFDELIPAGIVLTGGGSKVSGAIDLGEAVFQMPVRLGTPKKIAGLTEVVNNPIYSTGVGLLLYGYEQKISGRSDDSLMKSAYSGIWTRMKNWFHNNF
ncbi:MAG: cell division protein FtsA, partial [Legionellales bacterium]|nr:cell division protein FtsA [Legionellales bacterium]